MSQSRCSAAVTLIQRTVSKRVRAARRKSSESGLSGWSQPVMTRSIVQEMYHKAAFGCSAHRSQDGMVLPINKKTYLGLYIKRPSWLWQTNIVRPVPLFRIWNAPKKKTYLGLYIKRPSWLWQTNSVPLSVTAPPCDQFHLLSFGYGMF